MLLLTAGSDGIDAAALSALRDGVARRLGATKRYTVLPPADAARALSAAGSKAASDCISSDACRKAALKAAHAQVLLAATLTGSNGAYDLSIQRTDADDHGPPKETSETMRRLASLDINLDLSLGRLFDLPASTGLPPRGAGAPEIRVAVAPSSAPTARLLLLTMTSDDVEAGAAGSLRDGIAARLAAMNKYVVVSPAETERGFRSHVASLEECLTQKGCPAAVARDVAATELITARLARAGHAYVLTIDRGPSGSTQGGSTSETMKRLASLGLNIDVCLKRLFSQTPAPQSAPAPAAPVVVSAGTPSTPPVAVTPSPAPIVLSPPPTTRSAPLAAVAEPAPEARPTSTWRAVGIAGASVGAAALIVATVLGVTVQASQTAGATKAQTTPIESQVKSINARAISADTLFGVGGVLAGAGLGLALAF